MKWHIHDVNNLLAKAKEQIGSVDPLDADGFLLFNDCRGTAQQLVKTVKYLSDKPVYVVQHGRAATRDYEPPNSFPLLADKFLCWGKYDYERMVRLGYGDRTQIVGCPLLEYRQPTVAHDSKDILFVPLNADHEEPENLIVYYELLKLKYSTAQKKLRTLQPSLHKEWAIGGKNRITFSSISEMQLTAKILPLHDRNLYHGDVIQSNQLNPKHSSIIHDLLANIDCLVTLDVCTTEILALASDVPVVCCDIYSFDTLGGKPYAGIDREHIKGVTYCKLDELQDAVGDALAHPERLRDERAERAEYEMSTSIENPTERILEAIGEKVAV